MPAVIPIAMVAVSVAGVAMTAVGQKQQAKAQTQNAQYNAEVAEANAKIAEQDATQELVAAGEEENRYRSQGRLFMGEHRSARGTQGVVMSDGSPVLVAAEQAKQLELDALTIRYGGQIRARELRHEAKRHRMDSGYQSNLAAQYKKAGLIGSATAALSGASSLFDNLGGYRKPAAGNRYPSGGFSQNAYRPPVRSIY